MTSVYISGALASARDLARSCSVYEQVGAKLRSLGFSPEIPHLHTHPEWARDLSPARVFEMDRSRLLRSKLVLAFLSEPSLGVGAEIALALTKHIPVLGVIEASAAIPSRFIEGLLLSHPKGGIARFRNIVEIGPAVLSFLGRTRELETVPSGIEGVDESVSKDY